MSAAATVPSNPIDSENTVGLLDQACTVSQVSLLYNIVPRLVTPFSTMILAALLTPVGLRACGNCHIRIALARIVSNSGLRQDW